MRTLSEHENITLDTILRLIQKAYVSAEGKKAKEKANALRARQRVERRGA